MSHPARATELPRRSAMHRGAPAGSRPNIINAYALGDLMTREEFINSLNIDMESCAQAFREIAPEWYAVMPYETVEVLMHGILDAALNEDIV